jgi:hypothetical protein
MENCMIRLTSNLNSQSGRIGPNTVSSKGRPLAAAKVSWMRFPKCRSYPTENQGSGIPPIPGSWFLHQRIHSQRWVSHLFKEGQNFFLIGCHALVGDLVEQVGIAGSNCGFL